MADRLRSFRFPYSRALSRLEQIKLKYSRSVQWRGDTSPVASLDNRVVRLQVKRTTRRSSLRSDKGYSC
jgi:hypothetical protein